MKARNAAIHMLGISVLLASMPVLAGRPVKVVDEGHLKEQGVTSDSQFVAPGFPASLAKKGDSVCVTIGYNINDDGTTSNFGVLKSWNSSSGEELAPKEYWDDVVNVAAAAVSQWKFKAVDGGKLSPLYTAATFTFQGNAPAESLDLRGNCRVSDLTAYLQDLKSKRYQHTSADTFAAQQFNRQVQSQLNMVSNPGAGR